LPSFKPEVGTFLSLIDSKGQDQGDDSEVGVAWRAAKGKKVLFSDLQGFPASFADELHRSYSNEYQKTAKLVNEHVHLLKGAAIIEKDGKLFVCLFVCLFVFDVFLFVFVCFAFFFLGQEWSLSVGDFVVLSLEGVEEFARISQLFIHRGKDGEDRLFLIVRWFVPSLIDSVTTWQVLCERRADSKRKKYDQVFSFLSVLRKASVEHQCTANCEVKRDPVTRIHHCEKEIFLINPYMS